MDIEQRSDSLGEAASWDLEAIEKSARIAAIESSAAGVHMDLRTHG